MTKQPNRFIVEVRDGIRLLVPATYEAQQHFASLPRGERVEVVILRDRNPKFTGMVYKTMRLIGAAMEWRPHNVREWLLIRTGRADVMQWPPGSAPLLVPHGTGPSDMGRAELEAFWDDAREVIRKEVLPHVDAMAAEEIGRRLAPAAGSRRRLRTRRDSKVPKAEG